MKRLLLAMTLCFLVALTGCTQKDNYGEIVNGIADVVVHDDYSDNVIYQGVIPEATEMGMNTGLGVVRPEDISTNPLERPQIQEFRLAEGQNFNPYFRTHNGFQEPSTILVTVVLDYKQVEFTLDGMKGLLHQITVPPDTDINIPFSLDIDTTGAHDVLIIIFTDPYNQTLDVNYRMSFNTHALGYRTVVIVGGDGAPVRDIDATITGVPIPPDSSFNPDVGFASMPEDIDTPAYERQRYVFNAVAGSSCLFQMYSANEEKSRAITQVMIPFLDYHQVDINGSNLLVASLSPGEEALTNIELQLSDDPYIHQFQVIYLFDPYKSVLSKEVYSTFAFGSFRIAINAE